MKKILTVTIALGVGLCGTVTGDSFDEIKTLLSRKGCRLLEFISIIESDIFELVDSTYGRAYLASDGRYNINVGDEQYLYDLKNLYSYLVSNNQVLIEKAEKAANEEVAFITKLDEIYETFIIKADEEYRLVKKPEIAGDYRDTLIVVIDHKKLELKQIEYFDVNDFLKVYAGSTVGSHPTVHNSAGVKFLCHSCSSDQ